MPATAPDGEPVVLRAARRRDGPFAQGRPATVDLPGAAAAAGTSHPHLVALLDLVTHVDGRVVAVTAAPAGHRLDRWLEARGTIEPGEAVTVLLPVLAALAHLASLGVAVVDLATSDVEIDGRGAPVVVDFGHVHHERDAAATGPRVRAGASAARFVDAVSGHLPPGAGAAARTADTRDLDELVEVVHDLAEPLALATCGPRVDDGSVADWPPASAAVGGRGAAGWTSALPESAALDALVDWGESLRSTPLRERLRSVRPRFWALGGVVLGCLLVGTVLVPAWLPDDDPGGDAHSTAPPALGAPPVPPASSGPASDGVAASESPRTSSPSDSSQAVAEALVTGDDAAAATAFLLEARVGCLREPTSTCLAAVHQEGSPAAARDGVLVADPAAAGVPLLPVRVESEVQRLGESVLFACRTADDEPASVLVVRTEAGWRLRDVATRP